MTLGQKCLLVNTCVRSAEARRVEGGHGIDVAVVRAEPLVPHRVAVVDILVHVRRELS